jgi:hypothetical protein
MKSEKACTKKGGKVVTADAAPKADAPKADAPAPAAK